MRPLFKTLAELRESLAVSLGFGAMAGVIDLQIPILNQFLQQAQQHVGNPMGHALFVGGVAHHAARFARRCPLEHLQQPRRLHRQRQL